MRIWIPLLLLVCAATAWAAPSPPSGPDDGDLSRGTCAGHPSARDLLAALPIEVPELVVLWPRVGRTRGEPCRSVGRLTIVDHQGQMVTASFVLRPSSESAPEERFTRWYTDEGVAPANRPGPPRSEMVWVPEGAASNVHVVVAGAPSASEETLEGLIGFLSAVPPRGVLAGETP